LIRYIITLYYVLRSGRSRTGRKGVKEAKQRQNWGPTGAALRAQGRPKQGGLPHRRAGNLSPAGIAKGIEGGIERPMCVPSASDPRHRTILRATPPFPGVRSPSRVHPASIQPQGRFSASEALRPQPPSPHTRAFGPKPALTSTQPAGRSPIMENPIRWGAGQKLVDEPHSYKASRYGSYEVRSLIENSLAGGFRCRARSHAAGAAPPEPGCNIAQLQSGSVAAGRVGPRHPRAILQNRFTAAAIPIRAWAGRHQPTSQAMEGSSRWPTSSSP